MIAPLVAARPGISAPLRGVLWMETIRLGQDTRSNRL